MMFMFVPSRVLWFVVWLAAGLSMQAEPGRRIRVLTSIAPLYSWAVNVAGTHADVENLLPADVGPHEYQLKPRDLRKIRSADILLLNGLGLESGFSQALAANDSNASRKVIEVAAGVPPDLLIRDLPELQIGAERTEASHDHASDAANPHLWLDPHFARHAVSNLTAALGALDPVHAPDYAANAAKYLATLETLDQDLQKGMKPMSHRAVVTFHDAFPYFCRRYGLKLVGVIEEVPGTSPSPRYLADLSRVIRDNKVDVLFAEPQFDPRLVRQLATDLKTSVAQLDTLETGRLAATAYEDGMRLNLRVLQSALK